MNRRPKDTISVNWPIPYGGGAKVRSHTSADSVDPHGGRNSASIAAAISNAITVAIDTAITDAVVAQVEQWAKDNQIEVENKQIQDLARNLETFKDEMGKVQAKLKAVVTEQAVRQMARNIAQAECSPVERDLKKLKEHREDELEALRFEIAGLRVDFNTDKNRLTQRLMEPTEPSRI
ncbi:hypothetical protein N657DRAFT_636994 [Parathielavia appendiculata]|uniref:Uncharacterized protein n=1 Tax=Parathielavia appendiculata TaxID=2587402 RepID=A0AAN6TTK9_9PEZI|nr:hypothetical protein N657DRAFT_636994 [Parathielavia appendiculata]